MLIFCPVFDGFDFMKKDASQRWEASFENVFSTFFRDLDSLNYAHLTKAKSIR